MSTGAGTPPEAWTRYWAAGHAHSCPTSFDGFYGPQLRAFWARQAAGLGPADVVLDLGCGTGALLAEMAAHFPAGQAPAFVGVDAAELRVAARPGIVLRDQTSFSALPVDAASVSLAVSQFGFEYGASGAAWSELLRVLRPHARVAFVMHKRSSQLDAVAADDLVVAQSALAPDGVLAAASALAPYLSRATTDAGRAALSMDPEALAVRERFNAAVDALVGLGGLLKHGDYVHDILGAVSKRLAQPGPSTAQQVEVVVQGVRDHVARTAALREVALDAQGIAAVRDRLQRARFEVEEPRTIAEKGFEMGWTIEARR